MITFTDIISVLVGQSSNGIASESRDIISKFIIQEKVLPLLECLLEANQITFEGVIGFLSCSTINRNVNKRKLIGMIRNSVTNNELILFLSGYVDANIWMYHVTNKIFKVYYMEEYFQPYKRNVFVVERNEGYSIAEPTVDQLIQEIHKKYIVIPIGIRENKTWKEGVTENNPLYDDLEIAEFVEECPDDPDQSPYFNVTRLFKKIKV